MLLRRIDAGARPPLLGAWAPRSDPVTEFVNTPEDAPAEMDGGRYLTGGVHLHPERATDTAELRGSGGVDGEGRYRCYGDASNWFCGGLRDHGRTACPDTLEA